VIPQAVPEDFILRCAGEETTWVLSMLVACMELELCLPLIMRRGVHQADLLALELVLQQVRETWLMIEALREASFIVLQPLDLER
jgi:hypothetical protein